MKGIMVTLLIFLTTGIVVGQQSNSSGSSFNSASAAAQNNLLKPLEIGVSEEAIRAIRSGRVLVSKIAPVDPDSGEKLSRNVINGVSLFQEGKILNTLSTATVRGSDNGDGVLRFGLTDNDLRALENNQLKMDFGPSERGKYREIEVYYDAPKPNKAVSSSPTRPSTNNGFTPTRPTTPTPDNTRSSDQFAFGPRGNGSSSSSQTPFIPLPGPGDTNFMGPTLPAAGSWSPTTRTTQYNPDLAPNRSSQSANDQNLNQNKSPWSFPEKDRVGNEFQNNSQQNDRQNTFDSVKAKWEAERKQLEYENELARRNVERLKREDADRQAPLRWQQEQANRNQAKTPLAPILNGPTNNDSRLTAEQQYAYEKAIWELERRKNLLDSREDSLLRKSNLIDLAQNQITGTMRQQTLRQQPLNNSWGNNSLGNNFSGNQMLRTNMAQNVNPDWERTNGITPGKHFYPDGPVTERIRTTVTRNDYARDKVGAPDDGFRSPGNNKDVSPRVATKPERGIGNYRAAIPPPGNIQKTSGESQFGGTKTTGNRDDRVDGFVLFLLFCSLGLNIYFAFISRGFYVRYHELADELRETFSTTH